MQLLERVRSELRRQDKRVRGSLVGVHGAFGYAYEAAHLRELLEDVEKELAQKECQPN